MPTLPWQNINTNTDPADYTAMLTYLPLKHWWDTPRFIVYIIQIYLQLRKTAGLIGFSMRAKPLSKNYWTLSLWESERAMGAYIHTSPHLTVMKSMRGRMGQTAFVSWKVSADVHCLSWSDALERKAQSYH